MPNRFIVAWRDFDNDRQEASLPVSGATVVADFTGFVSALENWLIGAGGGGGFYDEESADPKVASTNPLAQNSLQLMVEVRDTVTGNFHTYRFPCPDLGKADDGSSNPAWIASNGVTAMNPAHADYATLVTEIETHILSKNEFNPVTVSRMYIEE